MCDKKTNMDERNNNQIIKKVLVIYTGGTIGMQRNDRGAYVPVPNAFEDVIKSYPELHNQNCFNRLREAGILNDNRVMVIPNVQNKYTIVYQIDEYDPLLDSSNMSSVEWIRIACDLKKQYNCYDGFVILHGTDTLSYTASVLSFLLENLGKPVIVTGSQIPIFEMHSDAKTNFLNSLVFATMGWIQEVCVCFANKLMRGNRTVKSRSTELDAFLSPNFPNLGQVAMHMDVRDHLLLPETSEEIKLHTNLEKNVRELRLQPMITLEMIRQYLQPPTKGIVLVSYGYGNIPSRMEGLLQALEQAVKENGILIVNVTQCHEGSIGTEYETSQELERIGVIAGQDMTPVAALVKLSYVLGREDWIMEKKILAMKSNIRGEMTVLRN